MTPSDDPVSIGRLFAVGMAANFQCTADCLCISPTLNSSFQFLAPNLRLNVLIEWNRLAWSQWILLIRDVFVSLASCAGSFWYSVQRKDSFLSAVHQFCIGRSDAASWLQLWFCSHSWTRHIVSCFHVNQVTVTCLFEVGDSKLNRVAKIAAIDATTVYVVSSSGREEFCAFEDWRCDCSSRCRIQYPTDSDRIPPHCQQKKNYVSILGSKFSRPYTHNNMRKDLPCASEIYDPQYREGVCQDAIVGKKNRNRVDGKKKPRRTFTTN